MQQVPLDRHGTGGLMDPDRGVDYTATTKLLRTRGTGAEDTQRKAILSMILCGGQHTQQRLQRAGLSADASPTCRFCNGSDEENMYHVNWVCPRWEHLRAEARARLPDLIP